MTLVTWQAMLTGCLAGLMIAVITAPAGAGTYALLSLAATGHIAPDWPLGLACGLGGQPRAGNQDEWAALSH